MASCEIDSRSLVPGADVDLRGRAVDERSEQNGPKHRALQRNPQVSLSIQYERPPYRAAIIDGRAELAPLDPDDDPTAGMATRYFGKVAAAAYERMTKETYEQSGLTIIPVVPTDLKGFDNTKALSTAELAFTRVREALPFPRTWL